MSSAAHPTQLSSLDAILWQRNSSLHLPSVGAARPWVCRGFRHHLLVILADSRQVRDFASDALSMMSMTDLPSVEILTELAIASFEDDPLLHDTQKASRGETVLRWSEHGGILLATPGALMGSLSLGGERFELTTGYEVSRSRLLEWLNAAGYERADLVWTPGQYTYRGGIVDLFDPRDSYPIRVEFFDDEIESMRFFATDSQRSIKKFSHTKVHALTSRLTATLEGLFPPDMHVVFFEPSAIENAADNYSWLRSGVERQLEEGEAETWYDVEKKLSLYPRIRITGGASSSDYRTQIMSPPGFRGRRADLDAYSATLKSRSIRVHLISETEHSRKWAESAGFTASEGSISEGFVDPSAGVALLGDMELSGLTLSAGSGERRAPLDWGDRLLPGQWVVHEDYGVARFMGSEQIESTDGVQEYLVLEYAEERRLKIPVMHFHKIAQYTSFPGIEPVADNLRGGHWKKTSARAKEQAEAAAKYLIEVYAKREITVGHAFRGDREQEAEFERTFPYKETADQLRAIDDILRDMSKATPMDRLLVGDVGFGKTEVAMRGAARAVFDGTQVAVMAPTTLLAQQHFDTFSSRFDPFGIRVEVVSRFVPMSRQRKILEDTALGKVDILIGTHRLLGQDIKFKNIGLLVIDEEHRFGVMHKEHLKNKYPDVDVLMLSATPIPRSLHLSLSGLRDLSLLQTPPRKRFPVITAIGEWSENLIKSAVLREKSRGGQIFYVHNRVESIDREALTIKRLFPKLQIDTAHGQMPEKRLKSTMDKFAEGELDILVCTTIIESGLDMPRANTLIVSDAHELGLAQMHQLRGRVGRREEQAFALFLHPKGANITKEASERLDAIAAMGEFGAGYELAKRDLEIRGGGELVGVSQHGTLGRVGFQRYCDLLEEAIRRAKGEYREQTRVEVSIPSAIPDSYIPHESVRIALYRKLLWTQDIENLSALKDETADRFGPIPRVLEFLFDVAAIRVKGPDYGIMAVQCGRDETIIQYSPDGRAAEMNPPRGWFKKSDSFIAPGGFAALSNFVVSL